MPKLREGKRFLDRARYLMPGEGFWRVEFRNYGKSFEWTHSHEMTELVIVCGGTGQHVTETGWTRINRGDIFLIAPGGNHSYEKIEQLQLANLLFDGEGLKPYLSGLPPEANAFFCPENCYSPRLELNEPQLQECEKLLYQMRHEQLHRAPGWVLMNLTGFLRICTILGRISTGAGQNDAAAENAICRILHYFHESYAQEITLAQIAKVIRRSPATVDRLFRTELDTTPMEYLLRLRLEKASIALRNSDSTIAEVAQAHGFIDANYFSTRFRKRFGVSPRTFRFNVTQGHDYKPLVKLHE